MSLLNRTMRTVRYTVATPYNHIQHNGIAYTILNYMSNTYAINTTTTSHRCFAAKAAKVKPAGKSAAAAPVINIDPAVDNRSNFTFLDILKDKADLPPNNKPDTEYPDWLWEINEPLPNAFQLNRALFSAMPRPLQKRTIKINRRILIKQYNAAHAKKQ